MNPKTLVQVYEGERLVYQGCYSDVENFLGYKRSTIERYATREELVKGKYLIKRKRYGVSVKSKVDTYKEQIQDKHLYYVDYIIWHISKFGNCAMKENPEPYVDEVRELGYEFTYREDYINYTDDVMRCPKKRPKSRIYILEGKKI